jgi:hypothetical protein
MNFTDWNSSVLASPPFLVVGLPFWRRVVLEEYSYSEEGDSANLPGEICSDIFGALLAKSSFWRPRATPFWQAPLPDDV